ncbi:MAG: VWA domain-containing protein [Pirellulales bacterium]|nr:VWA domain-containing protein [Pirellulales bacterium]
MYDYLIGNPAYFHLLWIVLAAGALLIYAAFRGRRAMATFATSNLHGAVAPQWNPRRRWLKTALVIASLAAVALALLDVRWGKSWREVPQRGMDVVFLLDVSHSMLAQDAAPNRLERAKQYIGDMVDEMEGDRVGLVTFAGTASRKAPLTTNYREFRQTLDEVGPHSVTRGGSDLSEALHLAASSFLDRSGNHRAIVVLTDGEDQGHDPTNAAREVYQDQGIRVFTVAIGDSNQGARIPIRTARGSNAWLQYEGQDVWTKANPELLEKVAVEAGGAFVPAGTKQVNMGAVYHRYLTSVEEKSFADARVNAYIPRYQWFIGLALACAALEPFISERRKTLPRKEPVSR